jgi:hypothetical protein
VNGRSLIGKTPNEILPALRLVADLRDGTSLAVAIRGGGPAVTPTWDMREEPLAQLARFHVRLAEALAAIQQHTVHRVTMPDVGALTGEDLDQTLRVGRLVRGEHVETTWAKTPATVTSPANIPASNHEFSLHAILPLTVRLDGQDIELDMHCQMLYLAARPANPADIATPKAGEILHLVPGSTDRAIIAAVPANDALAGPPI